MIKYSSLFLVTFVLGCVDQPITGANSKRASSEYSSLDDKIGQEVTLFGYISLAHEAKGLYLTKKDFHRLSNQCLEVSPDLYGLEHGAFVKLSGTLVISPCRTERVCINVCNRYLLTHSGNKGG